MKYDVGGGGSPAGIINAITARIYYAKKRFY